MSVKLRFSAISVSDMNLLFIAVSCYSFNVLTLASLDFESAGMSDSVRMWAPNVFVAKLASSPSDVTVRGSVMQPALLIRTSTHWPSETTWAANLK